MAILPRHLLKSFFERGDRPTQSQFFALIDSMLHRNEDNLRMGFRVYDTQRAYLAGEGAIYNDTLYIALVDTTGTFDPSKWKAIHSSAAEVSYDNTTSGIPSTNAQGALDSIATAIVNTSNTVDTLSSVVEYAANKGQANGYAGLDADGKVGANYLPQSVLGATKFKGFWNADVNNITSSDPALNNMPMPASSSSNEGWYFIVNVSGETSIDGVEGWVVGDWIISMGTAWKKVDNTDALISWNGRTGAVVPQSGDYTPSMVGLANVPNVDATSRANHTGTQTASTISDLQQAISANTDVLAHGAALTAIDITRRHEFVSPYSYCGKAPTGSAEASPVWTIKRIQVSSSGSTAILTATNVAWTDRLTTTYS